MEVEKAANGSAVSVRLPVYPEGQCPKGHGGGCGELSGRVLAEHA